jgi:WXG100 family type VII secretion target
VPEAGQKDRHDRKDVEMSEFRIDPAQLDASAKRVANHSTEIMSRIREVQKEVTDSQGYWQGAARQRYDSLMERWQRSAAAVQNDLEETVRALQDAARDYGAAEQASSQRFG